jgi:acyl-lipid omega-6 desaturase (Delta-12 desaturase)
MNTAADSGLDETDLSRALAPYARADDSLAWRELSWTALGLVVCWAGAERLRSFSAPLALLAAPATGAFMLRLFVLLHDCAHGSLFRSPVLNACVGYAIGLLHATPFRYWRRSHAQHHAHLGDLDRGGAGYFALMTKREYLAAGTARRALYRFYRHPLILFVLGPPALWFVLYRFPWIAPKSWRRERAEILLTDAAVLALAVVAAGAFGWGALLWVHAPAMALSQCAGVWLFFVQHHAPGARLSRAPVWRRELSAIQASVYYDLPGWLRWISAEVSVHHAHHLEPRVPCYRLAECMNSVPALREPLRVGLRESLSLPRLALWDEAAGRLIGFDEL